MLFTEFEVDGDSVFCSQMEVDGDVTVGRVAIGGEEAGLERAFVLEAGLSVRIYEWKARKVH